MWTILAGFNFRKTGLTHHSPTALPNKESLKPFHFCSINPLLKPIYLFWNTSNTLPMHFIFFSQLAYQSLESQAIGISETEWSVANWKHSQSCRRAIATGGRNFPQKLKIETKCRLYWQVDCWVANRVWFYRQEIGIFWFSFNLKKQSWKL